MKKKWILYIIVIIVFLGVAMHGNAASKSGDAAKRAVDLAADYRTLADSVYSLDMDAGEIVIEARLPIDGLDGHTLVSIRDSLPVEADTAILSDRFHGTRWLHVTIPSGPDNVYEDTLAILSALEPFSLDTAQLSLNAAWHTADSYSPAEKKDIIQSLFAFVGARTVAFMSDERIASASGYSPRLSGSAGAGADTMNITASLCANPHGGSTLWLGTPVLTVEY